METKTILKALFPHVYLWRFQKRAKRKLEQNKRLAALPFDEKAKLLQDIFYKKVGYQLNLNNPKSWCEKMQWLKLYDSTSQKSMWTDKIKAKEMASQLIGSQCVIPIIGGGGTNPLTTLILASCPSSLL